MTFDALDLVLKAIPQYGAPDILENGDILIRRNNPQWARKKNKRRERRFGGWRRRAEWKILIKRNNTTLSIFSKYENGALNINLKL